MASSARRRKAAPRNGGTVQAGAVALGGLISRNPVLVGASTAFLVTLFYVSANALWYQPFPHKGTFFATRSIGDFPQMVSLEPETTINIERPSASPAQLPMTAPVAADPIVQRVQAVLGNLGFYSGSVDGIAGPNTRSAIETYQRKVGLVASGRIDDMLLKQLDAAPAVPTPTLRDGTTGAIGPADATSPAMRPDARIVKVQAGLKAFGNDDIQLDGIVGARTKAAIREFQALFRLPETGEPDDVVYSKMREIGLTD